MRIGTNIPALSAHRMLLRSGQAIGHSLERLSTGLRINRAADDAAGLSVSEGLRSQAGGMRQAARNARDGINLVRTAEGALSETTSVLQRMRDLSVQAANDGGLVASARGAIQREIEQLSRELDRIATTTAYNGTRLLDGSYDGMFQVGAQSGDTIRVVIGGPGGGLDSAGLGLGLGLGLGEVGVARTASDVDTAASDGDVVVRVTPAVPGRGNARTAGSIALAGDFTTPDRFAASFTGLSGTISYDGRTLDLAAVDYTGDVTASDYLRTFSDAVALAFGLGGGSVAGNSSELVITGARPANWSAAADAQRLTPTYTAPPPPDPLPPPDPTDPTPPEPSDPTPPVGVVEDAVRTIDEALRRVLSVRADLGAIENRLEHTVARLDVAFVNTMAAFSRIRDADMATEMSRLTRNLVLLQAGTAMLAQANQAPRSALQLLM